MYDVFMQGKDLYSEIASKAFHKSYEECKEFNPDGTTNSEGKARRSRAKGILLGVLYGRGTASVAEQLKCSVEEAASIKESVFNSFPAIKKFEQESIQMAIEKGYVTTVCGRKRRLPSMQLPDYDVKYTDKQVTLDPLDFTGSSEPTDDVSDEVWMYWVSKMKSAKGIKARQKIVEDATKKGIRIIDNTRNKDTTKVVNARIQGSAADLTKAAMIELSRDTRLKELGFRMLIQVHDEIIAECPKENMVEVKKLFADTMCGAAEKILQMPIKCDVSVTEVWYGEEINV
jgi:DNA polymerase I